MCTRVYIYIYIVIIIIIYAQHQHKQLSTPPLLHLLILYFALLFAIFRFCAVRFITPTQHNTTLHYTTLRHTTFAVATFASRLQPFARYLIYIYIASFHTDYILTTDCRNAQPTVCNRFALIVCVSTGYIGGEHPYLPPKPVAQPKNVVIYFSEKIFFEKNSVPPLAFLFLFRTFA